MPTELNRLREQPVRPGRIVRRGLANRCPNCGHKPLFRGLLQIHERCPSCALTFDSGEGGFLGPLCINYGLVAIVYVVPMLIAGFAEAIPLRIALALALGGALALPALIYRATWSWWLMLYFLCLPHELPANQASNNEDPK